MQCSPTSQIRSTYGQAILENDIYILILLPFLLLLLVIINYQITYAVKYLLNSQATPQRY